MNKVINPENISSITLLIVDDHDGFREMSVIFFKRGGFNVLESKSGSEALEIVRTKTIDLILSDMRMPNGDGIFLLRQIKSLHLKIPVIVVSGMNGYTETECLLWGAQKVIQKPFKQTQLLDLIFQIIAKQISNESFESPI